MSSPTPESTDDHSKTHPSRGWYALLLPPYLGLLFPGLYARTEPALFGFPFFYWYQFAWVLLGAALTAIVYSRIRDRD